MTHSKKLGRWLGTLYLAATCLSTTSYAAQGNTVDTPLGTITGVASTNGSQFLGIPYAQPPVGELRWSSPLPIKELPDNFVADQFGPSCPQAPSPFGEASISEDCLYLNVYRPQGEFPSDQKIPVMVWIHGGAFTYGGSKLYDPTPLTDNGVIVVTINYRIGALGFMAHPSLSATSDSGVSGNYGIQDQQLALQWVQDNIANFGGDPDNVTIFGQSAGGLSSHVHLAAPGSAGLFNKAIIQSGAYLLQQPALQDWEYLGLGVAAAAGCPDQSTECLRNLPVETILANQDPGALGWLPIVDGQTLPIDVASALYSGNFNQVPVMEGTTADEYTMFTALSYDLLGAPITNDSYLSAITDLGFPTEAAYLISVLYPPFLYESPGAAYSAMGTDMLFACNSQSSLQMLSQHVPTYGYEFNDPKAPYTTLPPVSFSYGAVHGSEIQYIMNTVDGGELNWSQKMLASQMKKYWTNFAKTGNPNGKLNIWHRYNSLTRTMMSLRPYFSFPIHTFGLKHKCGFWNWLFAQQ